MNSKQTKKKTIHSLHKHTDDLSQSKTHPMTAKFHKRHRKYHQSKQHNITKEVRIHLRRKQKNVHTT